MTSEPKIYVYCENCVMGGRQCFDETLLEDADLMGDLISYTLSEAKEHLRNAPKHFNTSYQVRLHSTLAEFVADFG